MLPILPYSTYHFYFEVLFFLFLINKTFPYLCGWVSYTSVLCDGKAAVAGDQVLPSPPPPSNSEVTLVEDMWRRRVQPGLKKLCLGFTNFFNWMLKQNSVFLLIDTHLFQPSPQLPGVSKLFLGKPGWLSKAWERGGERIQPPSPGCNVSQGKHRHCSSPACFHW